MLPLSVRLLFLAPVLVLCCLLAMAAGRQMEVSASAKSAEQRLLQICTLPCWAGLTPGETDFKAVTRILNSQIARLNPKPGLTSSVISFGIDTDQQHIGGLIHYNRGRVGVISLTMKLPLSLLMDELGTPDCVDQPALRTRSLIVYWARDLYFIRTLLVASEYGRLSAGIQAQDLQIGPDDNPCAGRIPWQGFAPIWRYRRLAE